MRMRGRSTRSNRVSDRQEIGRTPKYNPGQSINRPPTSFRSISGSPPTYRRDLTGIKPNTTDTEEESE